MIQIQLLLPLHRQAVPDPTLVILLNDALDMGREVTVVLKSEVEVTFTNQTNVDAPQMRGAIGPWGASREAWFPMDLEVSRDFGPVSVDSDPGTITLYVSQDLCLDSRCCG